MRLHETLKRMSSALESMQKFGSRVSDCDVGAPVLSKRRCVDSGGMYFVHSGCGSPFDD